ncbi:hypothetical protein [Peribacillus simplex]|uniref:hypothetical protein n=1 Tax=Peribacillus simplex TaxID=1478 RepID=UPI0028531573|nr:hypothetical protein [Peribacillus simplex]MDR4925425.1 hypothetical protein [Peribacillus simplex]
MSHTQLGLIPESQLDYELGTSRFILRQQGFDARHFVYPGGSYVKNNAGEKTDTRSNLCKWGWLVLMLHVFQPQWATPEKQKELRDLIAYVKSKSKDIVTVSEGMSIYGKEYDHGALLWIT